MPTTATCQVRFTSIGIKIQDFFWVPTGLPTISINQNTWTNAVKASRRLNTKQELNFLNNRHTLLGKKNDYAYLSNTALSEQM